MPETDPSVVIDLTEYGMNGTMVMNEPTLERVDRFDRSILQFILDDGHRATYHQLPVKERRAYLQPFIDDNIFTYDILITLSYVKEAPFMTDDGLLPYHQFISVANMRLRNRMHDAIDTIQKGNPFALMNSELDISLGVRMFQDAVLNGTQNDTTAYYIMYATYLMNGGRKDDWKQLTQTDMTLMMLCDIKTTERNNRNLAIEITNAIGKSLNGGGETTERRWD